MQRLVLYAGVVVYLDGLEQVVAGHLGHGVVGEHHVDGLPLRKTPGILNHRWKHWH